MNKKVLFGMFGLAAGSLMADSATTTTINPWVAIKGGYVFKAKRENVKFKGGYNGLVEAGLSYDQWRVAMEVGMRQSKINEGKTTNNLIKEAYNKLNALSGMINVYYDYALTDECSLYLGLGAGIAKVSFVTKNANKVETGKTVFAWQAMAGVSYDINENWTVIAGYRLFNTAKIKLAENNKVKMPFASSLELGLQYNF